MFKNVQQCIYNANDIIKNWLGVLEYVRQLCINVCLIKNESHFDICCEVIHQTLNGSISKINDFRGIYSLKQLC